MAHHNSTPQTVLDAPAFQPRWFYRHTGTNRAGRRHVQTPSGIPKHLRAPATNVPYVKPKRGVVVTDGDRTLPLAA